MSFIAIDDSNSHYKSELQLELVSAEDKVSSFSHAGSTHYIVGTSSHQLFVVHRIGSRFSSHFQVTRLAPKPSNLLSGLLLSGFKLLGVPFETSTLPSGPPISHLIALPNSGPLLALGEMMSCWLDWSNLSNEESLAWEVPLAPLLSKDVNEALQMRCAELTVVDCKTIASSSSSRTSLLLLSTFSGEASTPPVYLVLHFLEIHLLASSANPVMIRGRLLVGSITTCSFGPQLFVLPQTSSSPQSSTSDVVLLWTPLSSTSSSPSCQALSLDPVSLFSDRQTLDLSAGSCDFSAEFKPDEIDTVGVVRDIDGISVITKNFILKNISALYFNGNLTPLNVVPESSSQELLQHICTGKVQTSYFKDIGLALFVKFSYSCNLPIV